MSEKTYALKCTHCAAPLSILGGGRVSTVTCEYCHAVLDMNQAYAVVSKFINVKRPDIPLELGMKGYIKGIEWIIIGWITYKTATFPSETWSEFFLYSPTHGYTWLVYDEGKFSFSKKVRDFDLYSWEVDTPKAIFYHRGHLIRTEPKYLIYVEYVEGELNWIAKFGDKIECWDYKGVGDKELSIEKTNKELEVYYSEKLNTNSVYISFNLEKAQKIETADYGTTASDEQEHHKIKFTIFILFFTLLMIILFSFFSEKLLTVTSSSEGNSSTRFTVTSKAFLTHIKIDSPQGIKNDSLFLYHNKKRIFSLNKKTLIYSKKHLVHHWSSTSIHTDIYLHLEEGKYTLQWKQRDKNSKHITISENYIHLKYILPLFILSIFLLLYIYRYTLNRKLMIILALLIIAIIVYIYLPMNWLFIIELFLFLILSGYIKGYDDE